MFRRDEKDNIQRIDVRPNHNLSLNQIRENTNQVKNQMMKFLQNPVNYFKRNSRSRLRHPKIAIPRKNFDKIRAFSIHSQMDEDSSSEKD